MSSIVINLWGKQQRKWKSLTKYLRLFSIVFVHLKWNGARLSSLEVECTSCQTSYQRTCNLGS